jgi:hypothetical protein
LLTILTANTELELLFVQPHQDLILVFTLEGSVPCTPVPQPTSTAPPTPDCTDAVPTPPSLPGAQQDLRCQGSNLAPREDCLGLLQLLPQGTNGGITSNDCLSGSKGTNTSGQLFCSLATKNQCSVVIVFGRSGIEPQSRDDIAAIINDSNMFCFRVCESGILEASSIVNQAGDVRVCIMNTDSAADC